jgi:hypothetical protein
LEARSRSGDRKKSVVKLGKKAKSLKRVNVEWVSKREWESQPALNE